MYEVEEKIKEIYIKLKGQVEGLLDFYELDENDKIVFFMNMVLKSTAKISAPPDILRKYLDSYVDFYRLQYEEHMKKVSKEADEKTQSQDQ